jgi:hypothetical protein
MDERNSPFGNYASPLFNRSKFESARRVVPQCTANATSLRLASVDLKTGRFSSVLVTTSRDKIDWQWSPDGKFLAYLSEPPERENPALFIRAVDTGQTRELQPKPLLLKWLMPWSPDGRTLSVKAVGNFRSGTPEGALPIKAVRNSACLSTAHAGSWWTDIVRAHVPQIEEGRGCIFRILHRVKYSERMHDMFHLVPIPGSKRNQRHGLRFTARYVAQWLAMLIVVLMFVLYVSSLRI